MAMQAKLHAQNKFSDPVLQKIYTLQDERKTNDLLPYLENANEAYREAAALAFASIQDEAAIDALVKTLKDKSEKVRMAAAFSLGQTKDSTALRDLQNAYKKESSFNVKGALLEAMGKCGTEKTVAFVAAQSYYPENTAMNNGIARALFHLANKKIVSTEGTKKAIELLGKEYSATVRENASAYLARAKKIDLTPYADKLSSLVLDDNVNVRINLAKAISKIMPDIGTEIAARLLEDQDYRVQVNALNSLKTFPPAKTENLFNVTLQRTNSPAVSLTAAEGLLQVGNTTSAANYYRYTKLALDWRTRTVMYTAALRFAEDKGKDTLSAAVMKLYQSSKNPYEQGMLLTALAEYMPNHAFIAKQAFSTDVPVIRTYSMEALTFMRKHPLFGRSDSTMYEKFNGYFQKAIESGDVAMIAIVASALRDTAMNAPAGWKKGEPKVKFADVSFMEKALKKLTLPRDIETYMELQQLIDYYKGTKTKEMQKAGFNHPIDWKLVGSLIPEPKAIINTSKGQIVMKLFTEQAPGSVANFIELAKQGFYDGKVFHRVVPNFVVQTGCPRGDGWGNTEHTIRSEFMPLSFETGYVGMASAGKDTEGSQWFITHSSTPHLDGNYTIFGMVTVGMEIVHQLEVGDKIISIEIKP